MATPPPCPAPPCLDFAAFLSACKGDSAVSIVRFIWIYPSYYEDGFYASAHFVAEDDDRQPLRCSQHEFGEARTVGYVEEFLTKLRGILGIT